MNASQINLSSEVSLKELGAFGKPMPVTGATPIEWNLAGGKLTLRVPTAARLEVYDHGIWRTLHDGKRWNRYGAISASPTLEWTSEFPCKFRIGYQGKTFVLSPENEKILYKKGESARLNAREWKLLGTSFGLHVGILGLVIGFLSIPAVQKSIDDAAKEKVVLKKDEPKAAAVGGRPRTESKPFQGMTYAKFLNLLAAKEFAADPAAVLMKKMNKAADAGSAPKVGQVGSNLGKVEGAVDSGGTSLSGNLAREKFLVKEGPSSDGKPGKKISDKQLALLKAKFRDLQSDFQRVYSRVLRIDPNLSVTVSLELLVQGSGHLSVTSFKARGTYRSDSLAKLKQEMTEIIGSAFVGQEFAGISLRGENVFVK